MYIDVLLHKYCFFDIFHFSVTTTPDGQMKIVKNVVVPNQTVVSGKNTLTSLLTSNNTKLAGRRILMTKGPDGTTRVITGTANILPKNLQTSQQSLIKTSSGQAVQGTQQQIQLQQSGKFCFLNKIEIL